MGVLLLWDRQLGISALFEEGDTLLLQFPVWVSSYDADDIADWACGAAHPVLMEVGPQSALFVHPAQLHPVVLPLTAGNLPLLTQHLGNENASVPPQSMTINLHSCPTAIITTQAARAPVAIVAGATAAESVVCPRIEALGLTFVHALPLPMLLCDAAPGMRGLCCMVQVLGCEPVRLDSAANAQVAGGNGKIGTIVQGGGRGCDVSLYSDILLCGPGCPQDASSRNGCHYMYKINDGWGCCRLILPVAMHHPSALIHKTVLLHGFDCRELVSHSDLFNRSQDSAPCARVVLMPHGCCRVLPITLNIGLALSAAAHDDSFSAILPAISPSAGGSLVAAVPRVCAASLVWVPSLTMTARLLSVLEGNAAEACRVVLQVNFGNVIQLPCSSLHPQLQATQLRPLLGSSVVCVFALERSKGHFQVESMYRC